MTQDTGHKRKALLASVLLALAISLVISPGMAAIADAKVSDKDPEGDTEAHEGYPTTADLDIKGFGFAGKNAYIDVYGDAGETVADHDHAIAYVIAIVTDEGVEQLWAIDSHEKQHGDVGVGEEWHAHRVVVDGDGCLNEVDEVNHATVKNHRVSFEDMKIRGKSGNLESVNAVEITAAMTVELHVLVDDPDNPGNAPCIAEVSHVFDDA